MPNKTTNFNLDLPVGDDLFNPLWSNSNTSKIDAQMKKNMDNSVTKANCVFNTNKFIITREDNTGKIFKFTAPHDFVAGYTFTVDGTAMDGIVAGTGDALADGCFMNGHEVIAYIDEATASLAFLVGSSLPDAIDATTLGGHPVDYFATAEGLATTNDVATSAGTVANQAFEAAKNVKGTWEAVTLAADSPDTMKDSKVFFNEKLGLAMFIFAGYTNLSESDVLVKLAANTFTIITGSFYIIGTNTGNTVIGTRAIKVTKYQDVISGEIVNSNLNGAATNTRIYQTVIVGATKN